TAPATSPARADAGGGAGRWTTGASRSGGGAAAPRGASRPSGPLLVVHAECPGGDHGARAEDDAQPVAGGGEAVADHVFTPSFSAMRPTTVCNHVDRSAVCDTWEMSTECRRKRAEVAGSSW